MNHETKENTMNIKQAIVGTGILGTIVRAKCQVTGRPVILNADCPELHLKQVLRYAETPQDAVWIAEDRYKEAQKLRKQRAYARRARREQAIADYYSLELWRDE